MRPNDTLLGPFVEMPGWLRALQQAVGDAEFAAPGATLGPLSALRELIALRDSTAPESATDRASIQEDLAASLDGLGEKLAKEIRAAVDDFKRNTLPQIPELLRTREGLQVAAASAQILTERFGVDAAVRAAWGDTVNSFRANDGYDVCLRHLDIVREMVGARGHAWITEVERIAQVINDDALHIARAGTTEVIYPGQDRGSAGLSETERLSIIEHDLARQAGDEEVSVWLLISNAAIANGFLTSGPIRFFDARFIRNRLLNRPIDPRPFEPTISTLRSSEYFAARLLGDVDEEEQAVLVQVPARGNRANAVAWAREIVSGILDVAALGVSRPGWNLEDGYFVVDQAGGWSSRRFRLKDPLDWFRYQPDRDLAELDNDLISAWVEGDSAAADAFELARWDKALDIASNEAFRVALGVRNLERVLPAARIPRGREPNSHWREVASYYLKEVWCWRTLRQDLNNAIFYATTPSEESDFEVGGDDSVSMFYSRYREITDPNGLSVAELITQASAIAGLFDPGSSRGRLVSAISRRTRNPEAALAWLNELGREFDVLLARAARQRNATVHGSATVATVVNSVLPFVSDLGRQVVETSLAAAASRRPRVLAFESARLEAIEHTAQLAQGVSLVALV
jgi:hypothetical protein